MDAAMSLTGPASHAEEAIMRSKFLVPVVVVLLWGAGICTGGHRALRPWPPWRCVGVEKRQPDQAPPAWHLLAGGPDAAAPAGPGARVQRAWLQHGDHTRGAGPALVRAAGCMHACISPSIYAPVICHMQHSACWPVHLHP